MPPIEEEAKIAGKHATLPDEELEALDNKVDEAGSAEELEEVLRTVDGINGSHTFYSSEEMIRRMYMVLDEGYPINIVTRSHGIRAKVAELLY